MSYYFAIIGTQDNPLFEHEFGTSKHGGDGLSRFSDQARHLNQFILHSSLDVVEEVQWNHGQMYVHPESLPILATTQKHPAALQAQLYLLLSDRLTYTCSPLPPRIGTSR